MDTALFGVEDRGKIASIILPHSYTFHNLMSVENLNFALQEISELSRMFIVMFHGAFLP